MNLSNLQKIKTKRKKRVGLGHGSGRGKTAGRGTKGQKARGDIPLSFHGGPIKSSMIKRLPLLRGKGKNKVFQSKKIVINVSALNVLSKNATADIETLAKHGLVKLEEAKKVGVKILGDGELGVALKVMLPVSKGAAKKIEKAGGEISKA